MSSIERTTRETHQRLTDELGRYPTRAELAEALGASYSTTNSRARRWNLEISNISKRGRPRQDCKRQTLAGYERLRKRLGRLPERDELAKELGLSRGGLDVRLLNLDLKFRRRNVGKYTRPEKSDPKAHAARCAEIAEILLHYRLGGVG